MPSITVEYNRVFCGVKEGLTVSRKFSHLLISLPVSQIFCYYSKTHYGSKAYAQYSTCLPCLFFEFYLFKQGHIALTENQTRESRTSAQGDSGTLLLPGKMRAEYQKRKLGSCVANPFFSQYPQTLIWL